MSSGDLAGHAQREQGLCTSSTNPPQSPGFLLQGQFKIDMLKLTPSETRIRGAVAER